MIQCDTKQRRRAEWMEPSGFVFYFLRPVYSDRYTKVSILRCGFPRFLLGSSCSSLPPYTHSLIPIGTIRYYTA